LIAAAPVGAVRIMAAASGVSACAIAAPGDNAKVPATELAKEPAKINPAAKRILFPRGCYRLPRRLGRRSAAVLSSWGH
jgi:hypothetical protein